MLAKRLKFIIFLSIIILFGVIISWAGGEGSAKIELGGTKVSVFAMCSGVAFLINWLAFIPANLAQTEKYYDLTGSLTFMSVILIAVLLSHNLDARALLVAVMVMIWTLRLGSFLFMRIQRDDKDGRFDEIKIAPMRFFIAWSLQALWVTFTSACALAIITGLERQPIGWLGYCAMFIWLLGFGIEVIADRQKTAFKKNSLNKDKFISTGLWAWSRHPNYFGEILLWFGVALLAIPVLNGWQWLCLISPVFIFVLINYISGVNKLERAADEKWRDDDAYQTYKKRTSILVLLPPKLNNS